MKASILKAVSLFTFTVSILLGTNSIASLAQSNEVTVVQLTQTGCQFVETEAKDCDFLPTLNYLFAIRSKLITAWASQSRD